MIEKISKMKKTKRQQIHLLKTLRSKNKRRAQLAVVVRIAQIKSKLV